MKHDFNASPLGENRLKASQIVDCIQATFVAVETFQLDCFAQNLEEFFEKRRGFIVVKDVLFGILVLFDVYHTYLQLRLDENL